MDDKAALVGTAVGRRWIAYTTIANSGDFKRLRQFIADNFAPVALGEMSVGERIKWHKELYEQAGKLRVYQVLASEDYQMVLIVQGQKGGLFITDMRVLADHPHKLIDYDLHPFEIEQEGSTTE